MELPFSAASENNRIPILEALTRLFATGGSVLEIGAGTGQHAVFFASQLPALTWQPADQEEYLWVIRARQQQARLPNLLPPVELEACTFDWSSRQYDHLYSANTAHIMSWEAVCAMFEGAGQALGDGVFALYGPFNRNGQFTSESNRAFDASLRSQRPEMGIRDDAALTALATRYGLALVEDIPMPANNRLLVWRRR